MAIREGMWDCPKCGKKGNRGSQKFCGGCGSPRGDQVRFYLPDNARVVTSEEELAKANAGPDWTCTFCGGDNPGTNEFCSGCGAARNDGKNRTVTDYKLGDSGYKDPDTVKPLNTAGNTAVQNTPSVKKRKSPLPILLILFGVIAGAVFLGNLSFEETLTVKGYFWERVLGVEEYRTLTESAWEGSVPSDARIQYSREEIHHYNKIPIGEERRTRWVTRQVQTGTETVVIGQRDMGNGYFEDIYGQQPVYESIEEEEVYYETIYREDPVYQTKYTYEVDRWVFDRDETASGADQQAVWPTDRIRGSKEREMNGKRREKYQVFFVSAKGKERKLSPKTEEEWLYFKTSVPYKARVGLAGNIRKIEKN